jgi:HK97 family phage portal protein
MGLFKRRPKTEAEPEKRADWWPGYPYGPSGSPYTTTASGISVTQTSALRNAAVWACQRVLKATISGLPVDVIWVMNGRKRDVTPQPIVVRRPSGDPSIRRRAWVGQVIGSLLMDGNIYCEALNPDGFGRPQQLETIDPQRLHWRMVPGSGMAPFIDGKQRAIWPSGDLWHVPASQFMIPGQSWAMSPTQMASTSIGTGIAAEEFGAKFFADGAHPSGVFRGSEAITQEQAEAIKARFMDQIRGSREPLILGNGWEWTPLTTDPKDGQFIDLLQFEVQQACRWYGVPPSMVYSALSGQAITYQNISDSDLMFLKYSVQSWVIDLEEAWSECIVAPQIVKFNVEAMLRMDAARRWDLHEKRLVMKTTSVNEVRILEDEDPYADPEFSKPGIPGGLEKPAKPVPVTPPPADVKGTAS